MNLIIPINVQLLIFYYMFFYVTISVIAVVNDFDMDACKWDVTTGIPGWLLLKNPPTYPRKHEAWCTCKECATRLIVAHTKQRGKGWFVLYHRLKCQFYAGCYQPHATIGIELRYTDNLQAAHKFENPDVFKDFLHSGDWVLLKIQKTDKAVGTKNFNDGDGRGLTSSGFVPPKMKKPAPPKMKEGQGKEKRGFENPNPKTKRPAPPKAQPKYEGYQPSVHTQSNHIPPPRKP